MFWPTPQDYREAIQNPHICFQDPELQSGLPELDRLGLPRPISGSFASVYRIKCGQTEWAIRCFTNNVKDQKDRYDAISSHLNSVNLPYMVPFEYLSEGIKINGTWFPIVKMQWVEGESLLHYIQRNLIHTDILRSLAAKWLKMINELQQAKLAHGDLQHGNILIRNEEIVLIDYDGMFVPNLSGKESNEIGHRNYQHPERSKEHFGPYIDNFSAWVILISIVAVCEDASLWTSLEAGEAEESLIFRQRDFVAPGESRAWELMHQVQDKKLLSLVNSFRDVLSLEVPKVPRPPNPEARVLTVQLTAAAVSATVSTFASKLGVVRTAIKNWFAKPQASDPGESSPSWVHDYLVTEEVHNEPPPTYRYVTERSVSLAVLIATMVTATFFYESALVIVLVGLGVETAFLSWRYRKLPLFKEKRIAYEKISCLQNEVTALTSELNKINFVKKMVQQMEEEKIHDLVRRQKEVSELEKQEKGEVEKELRIHVGEIVGEKQSLDRDERAELARALVSYQKAWLEEQLMKHRISHENIPEIDEEIKRRLRAVGIRTLADFLDINIFQSYGRKRIEKVYMILKNGGSVHIEMSASEAKALVEWRNKTERKYKTKAPQTIPHNDIATIKAKFHDKVATLDQVEQGYKARAQHLIARIRQKFSPEQDLLMKEEETTRNKLNNELHQMDKEIADINKNLLGKQWEIHHLKKSMDSFKDVNFWGFVKRVFLFK